MSNLIDISVKNNLEKSQADKEQLNEIMALFSEMNLADFEPLLDEELNSDRHPELYVGKYRSLAILNELFIRFKKSGDTAIELEQGNCRGGCFKNCSVINLQGNNSGKNFAFVIEKENNRISNFHPCYLFEDKNHIAKKVDMDFFVCTKNKLKIMQGHPPMNEADKKRMSEGIEMFYEKYAKK